MSNTDNTLPEELNEDIKQKAEAYIMRSKHFGEGRESYIAGATEYAQYKVKYEQARGMFKRILAFENSNFDNELTIGPYLINEIKSFLDGSK